jgi:hypothetical protein
MHKHGNLTTPDNFNLFKEEAEAWTVAFGMYEWEIEYEHGEVHENLAQCMYSVEAMDAKLILAKNWGSIEVTDYEICRCAYHEIMEVLLSRLQWLLKNRCTDEEINCEIHSIIHKIQKVMFEPKCIS